MAWGDVAWGDVTSWAAIAVSLLLGGWGLRQSSHANRHSAEALDLARAADARADRAERIQLERRDVEWEHGFDAQRNAYWAKNVGTDTAHNVVMWADPQGSDFAR